MVQPKNYLHTVMQSFSICCLITCVWMIFGYSLAFRAGSPVIGDASRFWLLGMEVWSVHPNAPSIPESVFMARSGLRARALGCPAGVSHAHISLVPPHFPTAHRPSR
jgi:ammonia channel protein AmtB